MRRLPPSRESGLVRGLVAAQSLCRVAEILHALAPLVHRVHARAMRAGRAPPAPAALPVDAREPVLDRADTGAGRQLPGQRARAEKTQFVGDAHPVARCKHAPLGRVALSRQMATQPRDARTPAELARALCDQRVERVEHHLGVARAREVFGGDSERRLLARAGLGAELALEQPDDRPQRA